MLEALAASPDRVAFEHGDRRVSYAELLDLIRGTAAAMRADGLARGAVVAVTVSLTPEGFAAHLAAYALGCTVVAVRPGWTDEQLVSVLGSHVVVADGTYRPMPADSVAAEARPDDLARVNFTSGSSGRPKGCCWTYAALQPMFHPGLWAPQITELLAGFDRFLVFGTWSMPVMLTFAARTLLTGGTVVIADDLLPLAPAIERHRTTGAVAAVPAFHQLLDDLRDTRYDLGSLRALVVTGSPLEPHRLAEAIERLGPVVWQGYGQSESGMISLLTPADLADRPERALRSVGRILPHVDVEIRDGRVFVRSAQQMAGYWGADAAEDAEVLRDGWLDTRDLGALDDDGFLYLTGRARDIILVDAHVLYAAPIERVLAAAADVDQAYVVGAPDEWTGEAVHAFVVPAGSRAPDLHALAAAVREELGEESVPKTITVIPEAPLGAGGKPDKLALRARLIG
ncbi:class I adenylate-forming enzyme family protein [Flindersiella endophytica]